MHFYILNMLIIICASLYYIILPRLFYYLQICIKGILQFFENMAE